MDGSNTTFQVIDEATWGTTPAVTPGLMKRLRVVSSGLKHEQAQSELRSLMGGRFAGKPRRGRVKADGPVVTALDPLGHGFFWRHLLGAPVTTGAGPYTHTWDGTAARPAGFTAEVGYLTPDGGSPVYELFAGATVASLGLKVPDAGEVEATWGLMGQRSTLATATLDAAPTDYAHDPFDGVEVGNAITEGGAPLATAVDLTLSIDLSRTEHYTLANQGRRGQLRAGRYKLSGQLTALFDDWALQTKARANTQTSLAVTFSRGNGLGGLGAESQVLTLANVVFTPTSPGIAGPEGIVQQLAFTGYTSLGVVLKNSLAACP